MNKARIAGVFYLLVFVTGGLALAVRGGVGSAAGLIAGLFYIAVTFSGRLSCLELWAC